MSEEMAVSDNTTGDEAKVTNDETATVAESEDVMLEDPSEPAAPEAVEAPALAEGNTKLSHNLSANITTYFSSFTMFFFAFHPTKLQLQCFNSRLRSNICNF